MTPVMSFIRGQRIQWLGEKPTEKRPRGRPGKRWPDVVEGNVDKMEVRGWRELAWDREKWKDIVVAAETLKEY